jgi:hypothetical protein
VGAELAEFQLDF